MCCTTLSPAKIPFDGGVLYPTFTQFSVYETSTHIYSQAIHVPGWGWGMPPRAHRAATRQGQPTWPSVKQITSQLIRPRASPDLRPMNIPAGVTGRLQPKRPSNRACVASYDAPCAPGVYSSVQILGLVHHGGFVLSSLGSGERRPHRAARRAARPSQN